MPVRSSELESAVIKGEGGMKDKKLSQMSRRDLIEIIYQLEQTEDQLRSEIADLKRELEDRRIKVSEAGTIADAALSLSGVFEAAQAACEIYINELRSRAGEPASGDRSAVTEGSSEDAEG